jgi:hypothetical protein
MRWGDPDMENTSEIGNILQSFSSFIPTKVASAVIDSVNI